jgi:hypothetical protein
MRVLFRGGAGGLGDRLLRLRGGVCGGVSHCNQPLVPCPGPKSFDTISLS